MTGLNFTIDGKLSRWQDRKETFIDADKIGHYGLRFADYADDCLRSIRHTGWFIDEYGEDKYRGCVFYLPGRDGYTLCVPGYQESSSGGYCVDLRDVRRDRDGDERKRDIAFTADSMAENAADVARDYNASWSLGNQYSDLVTAYRANRRERRQLVANLRAARDEMARLRIDSTWSRDLCRTIRAKIATLKEQSRDAYEAAQAILDANPYAVKDAFNDGAGMAVL